jgi:hypothetical protein
MKDNEIIKLRSTEFSSLLWVHSFLFFILDGAWVVWEVFSPSPELSPPLEWTCWGGGYGYIRGGGYGYGGGVWLTDEPLARRRVWIWWRSITTRWTINDRSWRVLIERIVDSDMGEDMTVEAEVVEREYEGMVLMRH